MATRKKKKTKKPRKLLSLSQQTFVDPPHSAASPFLSLSLSLSLHSAVHLCVTSVFSGLHSSVFLWVMLGLPIWGSRVGYASRRAMLQQLHGVTMYSHDEHHTSAPYCWSERGKGSSAANPSTAVLVIITRASTSHDVSLSCGPVSSTT